MNAFRLAMVALFSLTSAATLARDRPLAELSGPVLLTVTGLDASVFPGGAVQFDLNRLQMLGVAQITTSSIWTKGAHLYTGVLLRTMINSLHVEGEVLGLHALNDYAIDLPLVEVTTEAPLLAYRMDGVMMSVRDKGPVWVIYPYDSDAAYRSDETFARSVWQLDRIEVLH